jgi:hypothetical protein
VNKPRGETQRRIWEKPEILKAESRKGGPRDEEGNYQNWPRKSAKFAKRALKLMSGNSFFAASLGIAPD